MAEQSLQARICSKYDTYENWSNMNTTGRGGNLVLKKGEIGVCFVPNEADPASPTLLFKIGDGSTIFANLPWASGLSADVYDWAKAETKPTYTAAEVGALPADTVIPTVPTALKNPNALTFTGAVTGSYDGSSAKTVNIPAAITVDTALSLTSENPVQNKAVKSSIDGKISKSGDIFSGTLTYAGEENGTALDLGLTKSGNIQNVGILEFNYNSEAEGFYINAEAPTQDDSNGTNYCATAFFGGSNGDQAVRLTNIADPQGDADAANKEYVDTMVKTPIDMTSDYLSSGASNVQTWATMAQAGDATKYRVEPGVYFVNDTGSTYNGPTFVTIFAPMNSARNDRAVELRYHSAEDCFYTYVAYTIYEPGDELNEVICLSSDYGSLRIVGQDRTIPKYDTGSSSRDNNKFLRIVNGSPAWVSLTNVAEEGA